MQRVGNRVEYDPRAAVDASPLTDAAGNAVSVALQRFFLAFGYDKRISSR